MDAEHGKQPWMLSMGLQALERPWMRSMGLQALERPWMRSMGSGHGC